MSPRKFLDGDHEQQLKSGVVINGPRPTPLKVKQESHTIHKHHQQVRTPIIIYTRSPEVIHTKPHDFMALVQKLTGLSGSKVQEQQQTTLKLDGYDQNDNDSGVTDEKDKTMKARSPMFNGPSDIPLYTPNSSDYYFCSALPFFRFSDMISSSPNMGTSLSPGSLLELMKGLPEY